MAEGIRVAPQLRHRAAQRVVDPGEAGPVEAEEIAVADERVGERWARAHL